MARTAFFITGATGLLGTEVVEQLLATTDSIIRILVRAVSQAEAERRLHLLWWDDTLLSDAIGKRIIAVTGDITCEGLALHGNDSEQLLDDTTHVIHCAAETGIQKSKAELWHINVEGTRNVVHLAKAMPHLQRFTYISTAYVAGDQRGTIREEPSAATHFYSLYEQSKAEAERLVRQSGLPLTVCRPGMIVGNSKTGRTRNFNTVYYVLKLMLQNKLGFLPVSSRQTVNVVPVDYVAQQVSVLTLHPQAQGKTFHLVAPPKELPRVGELIGEVRRWARQELHVDIRRPLCLPLPFLRTVGKRYNTGEEAKTHSLMSNITALMPYFLDDHIFERANTDALTGEYHLHWRDFLPTLLSFACRHNFMRITEKTIFEQAVVRRESSHHPITYYNISANGIEQVSGKQMNALVSQYVEQLRSIGVKPGTRIALMGYNSTELAAIDNAIGLVGATSVPIYYTTPPEEVDLLLRKSGASWFFAGDRDSPIALRAVNPVTSATSPSTDLATIRYTSGTTGEPKGVMFSFPQLKWMGEILTNLLPWRERNSEMHYLSFLPMSHVVEGILAAYAPYCMLCKAKIYYLSDFQMLAQALPRVRPTVFFSVPRFYEKLWEQVEQNRLGQRYQHMSQGFLKTLTGRLLRWAVLRKAGLNRCSQLLVGSAPVSEELLLHFRDLGIEIHNAYGQTEAPLITLNRLGDNVIPSIGTPLPDTTLTVAPDGELLVRGPQVALGYYQLVSPTFSAGTLYTGDLGHIAPDGHAYIDGRKKDMLITSYGKNINCSKIEQLLSDIPCVEQAVLVGEQRPYCTALLWLNSEADDLAKAITGVNQRLSHPEQIRRWHVIETPLTIKNGELTPNLKVKRQVVWQHFLHDIEEMYAG